MLPGTRPVGVHVQVSESRMDLIRATIEGPAGTPYEGGLYVIDIFLPSTYPAVPPKAHYWAWGKYINPNLYAEGKVCLSLLGTWSGPGWDPEVSTLLQLLVSVQGLILIEHPYCNEPGQHRDGGSPQSVEYNKTVHAGVLDNMVRMSKDPPMGLAPLVQEFLQREGVALLDRARCYPNEKINESNIAAMNKALLGNAEDAASARKVSAAEGALLPKTELPSWLIVADEAFVSGYGDANAGEDDSDFDGDDY